MRIARRAQPAKLTLDFPIVLCAGEACVALFPRREPAESGGGGLRHIAFRTDRAGFEVTTYDVDERSDASTP